MAAEVSLVDRLRASAKYGRFCDETLQRVADWAVRRAVSDKDAYERAKRKLHQACGAFLTRRDLGRAGETLASLRHDMEPEELRETCTDLLRCHVSTRARIPMLETLYTQLFAVTGMPASVLDIGCGLHPAALPWMGLSKETCYLAIDADRALAALVGELFRRLRVPGKARAQDVIVEPPRERADLVFLLELLPALEQQEKGAGFRLLEQLDFSSAIVSFPTRTLSGRAKNLSEHHARLLMSLAERCHWKSTPIRFPSEPAAEPHPNEPAAEPHPNEPAAEPHPNEPAAEPHPNEVFIVVQK
ncbi:MAG: hypothetical protein AB1486_33515 [Planctomycetota bacterium]